MPGPNTKGLLETLFIYIFSRLTQASVQALYNISSSPVVLGPGSEWEKSFYKAFMEFPVYVLKFYYLDTPRELTWNIMFTLCLLLFSWRF